MILSGYKHNTQSIFLKLKDETQVSDQVVDLGKILSLLVAVASRFAFTIVSHLNLLMKD